MPNIAKLTTLLRPTWASEYKQRNTGAAPSELDKLDSYSMSGLAVLQWLHSLAQDIEARQIPGDCVECGVCNGGSAAAIACGLRDSARHVWLYDSFQGMPGTTEKDGPDAAKYIGECMGAEEMVREALRIAQLPPDRYTLRKGWFSDTFQAPLPETVSLLHIDADWYESVTLCLNTFYDRVPEGGIIVLDDFGYWEGCREAFYDFVSRRGIKPLLERFGSSQAYWVKGRTNNR